MLSFSNTSRARSCRAALCQLGLRHAGIRPDTINLGQHCLLQLARAACPLSRSPKSCTETAPTVGNSAPDDRRGETRVDQAPGRVARCAVMRRRLETRPQVEPLGARQHGIEHEHREEIGLVLPPVRDSQASNRLSFTVARERQPPLAQLLRFDHCEGAGRRRRGGGCRSDWDDPPHGICQYRRHPQRPESRYLARRIADSVGTGHPGTSLSRSASRPIVGCRYGCVREGRRCEILFNPRVRIVLTLLAAPR